MNASVIRVGDIVRCNVRGDQFYAEATVEVKHYPDMGKRAVRVRSLDTRPIPTGFITPRQIEGHWRKSRQNKKGSTAE